MFQRLRPLLPGEASNAAMSLNAAGLSPPSHDAFDTETGGATNIETARGDGRHGDDAQGSHATPASRTVPPPWSVINGIFQGKGDLSPAAAKVTVAADVGTATGGGCFDAAFTGVDRSAAMYTPPSYANKAAFVLNTVKAYASTFRHPKAEAITLVSDGQPRGSAHTQLPGADSGHAAALIARLDALKPEIRAWSTLLRNNDETSRRSLFPEINLPFFNFGTARKHYVQPVLQATLDVSVIDWLAARYEPGLRQIQERNNRNFHGTAVASNLLRKVVAVFRSHENGARDFETMLSRLPDMFASLDNLIAIAASLRRQLDLMDEALGRLATKSSEQDLRDWMVEQDAALESYKCMRRQEQSAHLAKVRAEKERRQRALEAQRLARLEEEFERQMEDYRLRCGGPYGDTTGNAVSANVRAGSNHDSSWAPSKVRWKEKKKTSDDGVVLPTPFAAGPGLDDFLKDVDDDEIRGTPPRRGDIDDEASPRQEVAIAQDEDYADC